MKNSRCSSCKHKVAVFYDTNWNVEMIMCEYEPFEFQWTEPQMECIDYEPNLHVNDTAPDNA